MSLKKKAIVSTMLMALSITPTVIPNSIVTPSIVMAAPASDVKASEAFEVNFQNGMPKGFEASDGWTNGYMFNVNWHKENVTFDGGNLQLIIDKEKS